MGSDLPPPPCSSAEPEAWWSRAAPRGRASSPPTARSPFPASGRGPWSTPRARVTRSAERWRRSWLTAWSWPMRPGWRTPPPGSQSVVQGREAGCRPGVSSTTTSAVAIGLAEMVLPAMDPRDQRLHDRACDLSMLLQPRGQPPGHDEDALGLLGGADRRAAGMLLDQRQLAEEVAWTHL